MEDIVEGLFSVLVTMGVVPIIRCPKVRHLQLCIGTSIPQELSRMAMHCQLAVRRWDGKQYHGQAGVKSRHHTCTPQPYNAWLLCLALM